MRFPRSDYRMVVRLLAGALCLCACLGPAASSLADPTAHFELRLAPGQPDAMMTLGDANDSTLEIELWVQVDDVPNGVLVQSVGVIPRVTDDGVVTFNDDYQSGVFTFCVSGGIPNLPSSGDFSILCNEGLGTNVGIGSPALYGTFTVSALGLGSTSYTYTPTLSMFEVWAIRLTNGTDIDDADCGDGSCNLTGSIDPAMAVIDVVDEPPVPRSADTDSDGDVDLFDYDRMQTCASADSGVPFNWCKQLDLNYDDDVDDADVALFVPQITGVLPAKGDIDFDGDIDLGDYRIFQICYAQPGEPSLEALCTYADVDRNGSLNADDISELVALLTGPS